MSCIVTRKCDRCKQQFSAEFRNYARVCGQCLRTEAEDQLEEAKRLAHAAARRLAGGEHVLAGAVRESAEHTVIVRMLCKGDSEFQTLRNLTRYWNLVRQEIEK